MRCVAHRQFNPLANVATSDRKIQGETCYIGKPPSGVLYAIGGGFTLKIMGTSMEICRSMCYSRLWDCICINKGSMTPIHIA